MASSPRTGRSSAALTAVVIGIVAIIAVIVIVTGADVMGAGGRVLTGLFPPQAVTDRGAKIRDLYDIVFGLAAVVFFLDLNGMKVINDSFGHEAGDAALSETAQILTDAFRESDIVARLGGDEFAIFAGDCDADGAATMRGRIERDVEASNQSTRAHAYRLSVSVGTAIFDPFAPLELDALLETADQAMYEQKRARTDSGTLARLSAGSGARQLG